MKCCGFFDELKADFEHDPEPFGMRLLPAEVWWRNAASRAWADTPVEVISWNDAIRTVELADAVLVENAMSCAFKARGKKVRVRFRLRKAATVLVWMTADIVAVQCVCADRRTAYVFRFVLEDDKLMPVCPHASSHQ